MANSKTCTIEGCERPHRARGMCTTHRYRFDNGLPMDAEVRQYEHERVCKVEGCKNTRVGGGDGTYCAMHRRRVDRRGEAGEAERQRAPFNEAVWNTPNRRRRQGLKDSYGMTVEQYHALLLTQNYRCAICGTDNPGSARAKSDHSFCVDHCHDTGAIRGLLCAPCNRAIGMLKDDPVVLEAAAQYLRRHKLKENTMADAPDLAGTDATTPPRGFMAVVNSAPASPEVAAPRVGSDAADQAVSAAMSAAQQNCNAAGLC